MTTELQPIEAGETLAYEMRIEAPPEVVWSHWVEADRIVRWMGDVARLEPRPGGEFRLEYGSGDIALGEFVEVAPHRRLVFTWGWDEDGAAVPAGASTVEVELDPLDDGAATLLRLRHTGLPGDSRGSHDEGWRYFLPRLSEAVARQ